jgi:nucleoside-triphosphatase THEP1
VLVATVHVARHPFTDALKRRPGIQLLRVSVENREQLPDHLSELLIG